MAVKSDQEKIALLREWNQVKETETLKEFNKRKGLDGTALYRWKQKYGDNPIESAREIKHVNGNETKMLRIENQRLRSIVADQALDIQALKEYCGRK